MSYILEALKKADAERERGAVPDLHAQPAPLAAAYPDQARPGSKPWLWLAAGAAIALVAVLAWQFGSGDAPPGAAPAPGALAPAPATVLVAPTTAPAAPTAAIAPAAPPAPPAAATPTAPPAAGDDAAPPAAPAPLPAPRALPRPPAATAAPRARAEPRDPAAAGAAAKAAKAAPSAPAAARVPLLAELPEDIRRQVPAMTIGGSVYSPQPANRMVIINGQVFREGSVVTPGLLLEQVGPKAAVFSLRGQRFEMPL